MKTRQSRRSLSVVPRSAPYANIDVSGYTVSWSRFYIHDIDQLEVSFTGEDVHSGATARVALAEEGAPLSDAAVWHATWDEAKQTTLVNGERYRLLVYAVNGTGLVSTVMSDSFVYDSTGPVNCRIDYDSTATYAHGEGMRITAHAEEEDAVSPDYGTAEYRLAIGTAENDTAISGLIAGNENGRLVKRTNSPDALFSFSLPDNIANGTYTVTLETENNAGVATRTSGTPLVVDNGIEKMIVRDSGPYRSDATSMRAEWEYTGSRAVSCYQYRIVRDGETPPDWKTTTATSVYEENLALANGATYYVEARGAFDNGDYSEVARSNGVLVDTTNPAFDSAHGVAAPKLARSKDIRISWSCADPESGIAKVEAMMEKYASDGSLIPVSKGWIPIGSEPSGNRVVLSADSEGEPFVLVSGDRVSLTLRITNNAGLSADSVASFILIDDGAPPAPVVTDQGEVINLQQIPKATWSMPDNPAGETCTYKWAVITSGMSAADATWYDADETMTARPGTVAGFPLVPVQGETWYFLVKATNEDGVETTGMSDGITFDGTAPFIADVRLSQGADTGRDIRYIDNTDNLYVTIDAYEETSQPLAYRVTAGTRDANGEFVPSASGSEDTGAAPVVPIANLKDEIEQGAITVFRGECTNSVDLAESGYTAGVTYDGSVPVVSNIRSSVTADELAFDWSVTGSVSPVAECDVAFEPTDYTGEHEWQSIGPVMHYSIKPAAANLADGRYRLYVRARNSAGTLSAGTAASDEILVDGSPAIIRVFRYDRYVADSLDFSIDAEDLLSGITEYQYRLGTLDDAGAFTQGWVSVFSGYGTVEQSIDFGTLPSAVNDGTRMYLQVRVKNGSSSWTAIKTSETIVADKTGASEPVVSVPKYTRYAAKIDGVTMSSTDDESGVWAYMIAVTNGTSADDIANAAWQMPVNTNGMLANAAVPLDGLDLHHGDTVYILAKTKNGSGLWSQVGMSGPVECDLVPPALAFDRQDTTIVANDIPLNIGYSVAEDTSDTVAVTFTLTAPDGSAVTDQAVTRAQGSYTYAFEAGAYGTYFLSYEMTDEAGNRTIGTNTQRIRLNSPPEVTLDDIETTPAKPILLSAYVYDPDGDTPLAYSWDLESDGSRVSTEENPTAVYTHTDPHNTTTNYTLTLTVTDSAGKSTVKTANVTVTNTERGTLYTDEYWSGTHHIRGDITVPAGITLDVAPGTDVVVTGDPLNGYDWRLTVKGSLVAGTGSRFHIATGLNEPWNGIYVENDAELTGVTISNAERGLAIAANAHVAANGCAFANNRTGVHAFGAADIRIHDSRFTGNTRYGVKEDDGGRPVLTDCTFGGNLRDYYGEDLTVMSMDELNARAGNSGNRRE